MKYIYGLLLALFVALVAAFISRYYGGPELLYALLLGLVLNVFYDSPACRPGVDLTARVFLRVGVALLGARITLDQVGALGLSSLLVIALGVLLTISTGLLLSRLLNRPASEGVLSGSAVGICGVSAALAVSSVLPSGKHTERFTLLTVVGVTILSTMTMVFYPPLTRLVGLEPVQAGIFLGGTIHDVAQVVAAGMLLGEETGDTATIIKLFRVMLLLPVVLLVSMLFRHSVPQKNNTARPPLVPGFLLGFVALMLIASAGWLPQSMVDMTSFMSRECLVVAIAATGIKTSFRELKNLGWQPVLMLTVETVLLAAFVMTAVLVLNLP